MFVIVKRFEHFISRSLELKEKSFSRVKLFYLTYI